MNAVLQAMSGDQRISNGMDARCAYASERHRRNRSEQDESFAKGCNLGGDVDVNSFIAGKSAPAKYQPQVRDEVELVALIEQLSIGARARNRDSIRLPATGVRLLQIVGCDHDETLTVFEGLLRVCQCTFYRIDDQRVGRDRAVARSESRMFAHPVDHAYHFVECSQRKG